MDSQFYDNLQQFPEIDPVTGELRYPGQSTYMPQQKDPAAGQYQQQYPFQQNLGGYAPQSYQGMGNMSDMQFSGQNTGTGYFGYGSSLTGSQPYQPQPQGYQIGQNYTPPAPTYTTQPAYQPAPYQAPAGNAYSAAAEENSRLRAELAELRRLREKAEKDLEDQRRQAESELTAAKEDAERRQQEALAQIRMQYEAKDNERQQILSSERATFSQQLQQYHADRARLDEERRQLEEARNQINEARNQVNEARSQVTSMQQSFAAESERLRAERQQLDLDRAASEQTRQQLQAEWNNLEAARQQTERTRNETNASIQDIEQQKYALFQSRQQLEQDRAALEQRALQEKTAFEQRMQQERAVYEQQKQQERAAYEQEKQLEREAYEQQKQQERADYEQRIQQERADYESRMQQERAALEQRMQQEKAAMEQELQNLTEQRKQIDDQKASSEEIMRRLSEERAALDRSAQELNANRSRYEESLQQLNQDKVALEENIQKFNLDRNELEKQKAITEEDRTRLAEERLSAERLRQQLDEDRVALEQSRQQSLSELAARERLLEETEKQSQAHRATVDESRMREAEGLRAFFESQRADIDRLRSELETAQRELEIQRERQLNELDEEKRKLEEERIEFREAQAELERRTAAESEKHEDAKTEEENTLPDDAGSPFSTLFGDDTNEIQEATSSDLTAAEVTEPVPAEESAVEEAVQTVNPVEETTASEPEELLWNPEQTVAVEEPASEVPAAEVSHDEQVSDDIRDDVESFTFEFPSQEDVLKDQPVFEFAPDMYVEPDSDTEEQNVQQPEQETYVSQDKAEETPYAHDIPLDEQETVSEPVPEERQTERTRFAYDIPLDDFEPVTEPVKTAEQPDAVPYAYDIPLDEPEKEPGKTEDQSESAPYAYDIPLDEPETVTESEKTEEQTEPVPYAFDIPLDEPETVTEPEKTEEQTEPAPYAFDMPLDEPETVTEPEKTEEQTEPASYAFDIPLDEPETVTEPEKTEEQTEPAPYAFDIPLDEPETMTEPEKTEEQNEPAPYVYDIPLDEPKTGDEPAYTAEEVQDILTPDSENAEPVDTVDYKPEDEEGFTIADAAEDITADDDMNGFSIIDDFSSFDIKDDNEKTVTEQTLSGEQSFSDLLNQFTAQLNLDDLPSSLDDVTDFALPEEVSEPAVPEKIADAEPDTTTVPEPVVIEPVVSAEEPAEVPKMFTISAVPQLVFPESEPVKKENVSEDENTETVSEPVQQNEQEKETAGQDDFPVIEDFNPVMANVREREEAALREAQEQENETVSEGPFFVIPEEEDKVPETLPQIDIPEDIFSEVKSEGEHSDEAPAEEEVASVNATEDEQPEVEPENAEVTEKVIDDIPEDIYLAMYTEPEEEDVISLPVDPTMKPADDVKQTEGNNGLFDFDSAVDGLAAAVLRDNAWLYSMNNLTPAGEDLVKISGLTSKYYVNEIDCSYPSYREINCDFPAGTVSAVISSVPFCSYAFVRAIACPEEVAQGTVMLGQRKLTHNDVLYVGSDRLAEKGRQTLDWLMSTIGGKTEQKRARLLPILEKVGMSNLADIQMESLSYSQRMLVLLIAVSFSNTPVILINDPKFEIEEIDVNSACEVFKLLTDAGKAVLIAGHSPRLLRSVANRVLAIHYGNQVFSGSYRSFIEENCNALVVFHSSDAASAAEKLSADDRFEVSVDRDIVEVMRAEGSTAGEKEAIEAARDAGVPVESLRNGDKGFSIAYKEVFKSRPRV